ncbi:family 43 glycosylhydrolase [Paenibacillus harenae]|uniref:GH43 family beta-xylosidase n=1 Tax=Paenibacillus harenae TaxID=306543 RepID=A0ABT9U7U0_PAEHA|nr:family 43 glycosylhydrolase [Paenibacillus harenae]MDQ0114524.1 GH43 family beta-xylosidase [Paenibacillus harenae]
MSHAHLYAYIQLGDSNRKSALCLAAKKLGQLVPLNEGQPVLFPLQGTKKLGSPVLFRKPDGKLGLAAADHDGSEYIFVYDCGEDWTFVNERYIRVNASGIPVRDLSVSYDKEFQIYRLMWSDGTDGYMAATEDWEQFSEPAGTDYTKSRSDITVEEAVQASRIAISDLEYAAFLRRYNKPHNTGITEVFPDLAAPPGSSLQQLGLPGQVTATYSDGSVKKLAVTWDATGVDFDKPGTYPLTGRIRQPQYPNPFIRERADPYIIHDAESGYYYFTASYPTYGHDGNNEVQPDGYDRIVIRRARTIEGLASAEETEVWNEENSSVNHRYIWAPELHNIQGKWYILCTAGVSADNVWSIRPIFIPCHGDVMDPAAWSRDGHWAVNETNDGSFGTFSLDMTYFEHRGTHYVIWAEKPAGSRLYMATIDPGQPWRLTSRRIELSAPDYAWEQAHGDQIDEGPAVIKQAGRILVFFSAGTVDANYCMGYLHADEDADLMNLDSWTKHPYPVLSTCDFSDGQQGPGHNSFTVDELGNAVLCYHARTEGEPGDGGLNDPGRHARVKSVHFAHDGRPILHMRAEDELHSAYADIAFSVKIM